MEAAQLLFILYHCVLAIFLILKIFQVSVIFCHCFSLISESCSTAVYFVSLCPGNFSNSDNTYDKYTDICIGGRVAISNVNILPEIGLHNGAVGTVVEIVYDNKPQGPTDKDYYHFPDYVVVNFPNLKLPARMQPWDQYHKRVSFKCFLVTYLIPMWNFFQIQKITRMPAAHTHCYDN